MSTVVLLRRGQSQWNAQNRYTGWHEVSIPTGVPLIHRIAPDGRAVDEMPVEHRHLR